MKILRFILEISLVIQIVGTVSIVVWKIMNTSLMMIMILLLLILIITMRMTVMIIFIIVMILFFVCNRFI